MEQKTAEEIYLDNGCNSKRDIIEAMQSYADQEVSNAIDKALIKCSAKAITHSYQLAEQILSLKPEILKELNK